jgi:hypothetical protein
MKAFWIVWSYLGENGKQREKRNNYSPEGPMMVRSSVPESEWKLRRISSSRGGGKYEIQASRSTTTAKLFNDSQNLLMSSFLFRLLCA